MLMSDIKVIESSMFFLLALWGVSLGGLACWSSLWWSVGEAPLRPLALPLSELFSLHTQNPSPPRCARTGQAQIRASRAAPGIRRL